MWALTVMEVLFAGSMLSLAVDIGGRVSGRLRRYGAGVLASLTVAVSLVALAWDWGASLGPAVQLQPVQSFFASLYLVDKYTTMTAFTVLVIGLAVSLYSLRYLEASDRPGPYYALLLLLLCSLVGVVSAGDLLVLFLFWEGMSVSAYGLVSFGRAKISMEAVIKYFLMTGVGSLMALYGIAAVYVTSGSIQLQAIAQAIASGSAFAQLGVAILLIGLGVEAAVVPLHTWLPDVYASSPIPVAALVAGAETGAAVFALAKVVQPLIPGGGFAASSPGWLQGSTELQIVIGALALITMLVGNLSALAQTNLRRMLSFSSVAQTGYMLAALSTMSVAGLVAVVFTIWNHGLVKSNFFLVLGRKDSSLESSELGALRGAGRKDRVLGFLYASSSLAMVGAPPFGMFWSEILVVQSLLLAGLSSGPLFYLLAAAVVLNIVVSIGYYFRVVNTVVFGEAQGETKKQPLADLLPSASLLALSLATGVAPFLILGQVL